MTSPPRRPARLYPSANLRPLLLHAARARPPHPPLTIPRTCCLAALSAAPSAAPLNPQPLKLNPLFRNPLLSSNITDDWHGDHLDYHHTDHDHWDHDHDHYSNYNPGYNRAWDSLNR